VRQTITHLIGAGLATVGSATPPGVRAYHVSGPQDAGGFIALACVEFLVHTDDALTGFGIPFGPDADLRPWCGWQSLGGGSAKLMSVSAAVVAATVLELERPVVLLCWRRALIRKLRYS
jgi:hypothetical protein